MFKHIIKKIFKEHREGFYRCICIGKITFRWYSSKYALRQIQEEIGRLNDQYVLLNNHFNDFCQSISAKMNDCHRNSMDRITKLSAEQDRQFATVQCLMKAQLPNTYVHLSAYAKVGNAGDNLLVPALRDSIQKISAQPVTWCHRPVRSVLDAETVELINATKGLIIGGGGLFLKDTNRNDISGWQWPCSLNELDKIQVPMYMLGVGYNRFRGQEDFEPYFKNSINEIAKRFSFVGLRNHGSVRAIQQYLSEELREKVCYHPCATTVLSKIYRMPSILADQAVIAVNCAFDRSELRYGDDKEERLRSLAKVLKQYEKMYTIKYYAHVQADKEILPIFDSVDLKYDVVELDKGLTIDAFLRAYCEPTLVLAMRGHAQMIPFGCGTPVLSIISHDKLKWFLEDINHLEWGVEVRDKDFEENLGSTMHYMLSHLEQIKEEMRMAQDQLWEVTQKNIRSIFNCD